MTLLQKSISAQKSRKNNVIEAEATPPVTGRQALVLAALSETELSNLAKVMAAESPQIVLICVPSPGWAKGLARHLHWNLDAASAHAVVDLKKDGNRGLAVELTEDMSHGHHLVLVSHDSETLLPQGLLSAVDTRFTLSTPSTRLMRQAIFNLTKEKVSGLRSSDFVGLDFDALALALRAGSTPRECKSRLRRASQALRRSSKKSTGVMLADLPLSAEIANWSAGLLADLRRVEEGQMDANALAYPLLEGPPGTGKTLIASALARSAGWRLVSTSVGDWFSSSDGHLGGVSRAMGEFFTELMREPFTIGFIDELDAIPNRSALSEKNRDFWTPVVTLLLLQIDRLRLANKPFMLMGATNHFNQLDAALIRSRRLERRISVLPPSSTEEVFAIFKHYLQDALEPGVIEAAARLCRGKTPADIEAMVLAARSLAASAGRSLQAADLLECVVPAELRSAEELRATAIHEAGHAVVSLSLGLPVETVSIIAQGQSGGLMQGAINSQIPNRDEVETMVMIMLGGRAADMVLSKGAHAGAERDLSMATSLMRKAIGEWGLYDSLVRSSSVTALQRLEEQVEPLLQILLQRALGIIEREQAAVLALAEALLNERVVDRKTVETIFQMNGTKGKSQDKERPSHIEVVELAP